MVADASDAVPEGFSMVSGVVEGTSASDALEAAENPWLLFAFTVQV
jgi:hypothetical protein